jgi:DNA-binding response OmpR family regulator
MTDSIKNEQSMPTETGPDQELAAAPMVLIIEDDPDISMSLKLRLKMNGFRVSQAFDATSAVDIAVENEPNAVILDVSLPGGTGLDVAERLRDTPTTASVPIIFLSASMRSDLPDRAVRAGGSAFMLKPYKSSELVAKVKSLIAGVTGETLEAEAA